MSTIDVRDIFGNKTTINEFNNDNLSAGRIRQFSGKDEKHLWPHHKEDEIDRIVKKYGQATGYSKWQNEKHPVVVTFPRWVHHVVK